MSWASMKTLPRRVKAIIGALAQVSNVSIIALLSFPRALTVDESGDLRGQKRLQCHGFTSSLMVLTHDPHLPLEHFIPRISCTRVPRNTGTTNKRGRAKHRHRRVSKLQTQSPKLTAKITHTVYAAALRQVFRGLFLRHADWPADSCCVLRALH